MNFMMNDRILQCQGRPRVDHLTLIPSMVTICLRDMNKKLCIPVLLVHQTLKHEFSDTGDCHEHDDSGTVLLFCDIFGAKDLVC